MRTDIKISKTRQSLQMIAVVTCSIAIIGASIVFVTEDYRDMYTTLASTINSISAINALKPIRSDAQSEQTDIKGTIINRDADTGIILEENTNMGINYVETTDALSAFVE